MSDHFDFICIGAGTVAEALAAQLEGSSLSLAVIEAELVGGECAFWGCMPSKALLRSAEVLAEAARARVLAASQVEWKLDFAKIAERTSWLAGNLDDASAARAIEAKGARLIRGRGRLIGPGSVVVGERTLRAARGIVIATGTAAAVPPIPGLEGLDFWTNREAVLARQLPETLLVLGGGPIGVELAQAFARFGTRVQVIEMADRLLAAEEPEAGAQLAKYFETEGISVRTSAEAASVSRSETEFRLTLRSGEEFVAEKLLVATGRRPRLDGFDLQAAGVSTTAKGWVSVDPQTLIAGDGVWAGGDITGLGAFTHLAWYHGTVIGKQLLGQPGRADHGAVPRVTYTDPEIASVGVSEKQARERFGQVQTVSADVGRSGRGSLNGGPGGMIKLVADTDRGVLVGALVVSPRAGEIIAELTLAIRAQIPLPILADTLHAFPTFSRILDGMLPELAQASSPG